MLNVIILIGRLTRDPELRYTQTGKAVATIRIAVDRGGEAGTDFIDVVVWERQAENAANYLRKGRLVAVQGWLQIREYEKDGQRRERAEIVANQLRFLDRSAAERVTGA